jgi:2'-5' RNA ligase
MSAGPGERWRCFVAVPLDDDLRMSLGTAIDRWREDPATDGLRWVRPEAMHLTLAFLGSVESSVVAAVEREIERVAGRHRPSSHATGRLGAFARPGSARVLWYAVHDPHGSLATIATDLEHSLQLDASEPYRPHVTLARARRRSVDLRGWIEEASAASPEGTLDVTELRLMRSHLGGGPARYETLAAFLLGGHPQ